MVEDTVAIAHTHRAAWPGTRRVAPVESNRHMLATAWLRARRGGELDRERAFALGATPPSKRRYDDRAQLEAATTADPRDVERVQRYCTKLGITVHAVHWRSLVLDGPVEALVRAFGADVALYADSNGTTLRQRTGSLHAPGEIAQIVRAVFGYAQWPRSRKLGALHPHGTALRVHDVAKRYRLPDADGSGTTIGILQLHGAFRAADFEAGMRLAGVHAQIPVVRRVDDVALQHEAVTEKDCEAALDTQIVGAFAPSARVVVYDAPDDERGILDAIRTAILDDERCDVLSISYGVPEHLWTPVALTLLDELFTLAALSGVTVCAACGDHGEELTYDGMPHVLAPASNPLVIACGGTVIDDHDLHGPERAWRHSGHGASSVFAAPPWQAGHAGRAVPDVVAQQDPGYATVLDGVQLSMGGTSSVAPFWAALVARLNQRLRARAGFFTPQLYANATTLANRRARWSARTGLGAIDASALERALREET